MTKRDLTILISIILLSTVIASVTIGVTIGQTVYKRHCNQRNFGPNAYLECPK